MSHDDERWQTSCWRWRNHTGPRRRLPLWDYQSQLETGADCQPRRQIRRRHHRRLLLSHASPKASAHLDITGSAWDAGRQGHRHWAPGSIDGAVADVPEAVTIKSKTSIDPAAIDVLLFHLE